MKDEVRRKITHINRQKVDKFLAEQETYESGVIK